ncbi:respiratory nitrate reductase subunit gamma [Actinokineospora sp. NPDC004072]
MTPLSVLEWTVLPYLAIAVLVGGVVWRFRHDRFGITSRSSQLHESRLLRVASPVFHFGLLLVLGGHVAGLLVPKAVTEFAGVDDHLYHLAALGLGTLSGAAATAGLGLLAWRRWRTPAVRTATTRGDLVVYAVLGAALLLGMAATVLTNGGGGYDYRATIAPWTRGILTLHPHPELMVDVPLSYQLHTLAGMVLLALVPYGRLVHALTAPVQYLFRPYLVYRVRDSRRLTTRPGPRGWNET